MPEIKRFDSNEDIEEAINFVGMKIIKIDPTNMDPKEITMNVMIHRALKELLVYRQKINESKAKTNGGD